MTSTLYLLICVYLFIFSACMGSFLHAVSYRLSNNQSFVHGRSCCPKCHNQIKAYDLIPILSYIFLGGRCRNCKEKISPIYPLSELVCAILAVACFLVFGISWLTLYSIILMFVLFILSLVDIRTMEIPNGFIVVLAVLAVPSYWLMEIGIWSHVIGFFVISLPMLIVTYIIKDCFGGGDIKLIAVCGFILGWKLTLFAFFVSLIVGGLTGIVLLLSKKVDRKQHIPFGPSLCIGIFVSLLFGDIIINGYLQLFSLV